MTVELSAAEHTTCEHSSKDISPRARRLSLALFQRVTWPAAQARIDERVQVRERCGTSNLNMRAPLIHPRVAAVSTEVRVC